MQSLPSGYRALVIGGSGAIGGALLASLRADARCACALSLGRTSTPAVDFEAPASIADAAQALSGQGPWHLVVVATGMLQGATGNAEKRLGDIDAQHMAASFAINTIGPALALAHFAPQLPRDERSVFAVLSAKVGSIGDNRLGGWYSYRASKAALNMVVKTAAIELARTHPRAVLAAMHPGTVDSRLSAPFRGAQIGRPAEAAAGDLLAVLDRLDPADSGGFWAYDGERLPW
ncbi:MAG: SDR family NAD(P)-dependent oxidoreductase [Gammaproteobacteria bacterium]|nr:SDR family NAD(P)-dependent oxidoreductase [Gammaproteobacteria bacterium]MBU1440106.1 SDR family NAD(P)-dependent oxidoreductase [Gammaproteobacteria bacterium]MBU2285392.1 SDR family NAD(P)-dependent oxidoreductase [Gammaproteobacteria bacterium]MBU2408565.1 SDR family NAD(P)-dependent oxidoreductase [Gammaproteobacteria bacterium]